MRLGSRMVFGVARKEETTVEKVPHPRLMVQSGPAVLFAHLSTSTDGTTVLYLHHRRCRHYDIDMVGHPRRQPAHFDVYFSPLRSREGGFPCFSSPPFGEPFVSPRPPRRGGKGARRRGFRETGVRSTQIFRGRWRRAWDQFQNNPPWIFKALESIHESALPPPLHGQYFTAMSYFIAADF